MEQSEKTIKVENEEVRVEKKCGQTIHVAFGHLINTIRLASPLSYDELQMNSRLNSSTIRRLERETNFSILKYIEAGFYYLTSIMCDFNIQHLCRQIERSVHNGKCLVVTEVDSSDLYKYDPKQIILRQESDDIEEQQKRALRTQKKLRIIGKLEETKWKKESANPSQSKKKKKK